MTAAKPQPIASASHCPGATARGLSSVELMCTLAITLILLGGSWPMFDDLRASQALRATADLLETDIQYARSLAIATGAPVRLSIQATAGGGSCYTLHTGAAQSCRCDGSGQAQCQGDSRLLRLAEQVGPAGITLAPAPRSFLFDGGRGTVTPTATVQVRDRAGRAIHQIVNIMGRVRSCTTTRLAGLHAC